MSDDQGADDGARASDAAEFERASHPGKSDREAILARRSRFVAMALAGLATTACGDDGFAGPQVCLEAPPVEVSPGACLAAPNPVEMHPVESQPEPVPVEPEPEPEPEGPIANEQGPNTGQGEADQGTQMRPPPRPCLRVRRPPPRPCLTPPVQPMVCLTELKAGNPDEDEDV